MGLLKHVPLILVAFVAVGCKKASIWEAAAAELPKARSDARAAGSAVEATDLPVRSVPKEKNAAEHYRAAIKAWGELSPSVRDKAGKDFQAAPADPSLRRNAASVRASLRAAKKPLDLMLKAAALPECDFERDYGQGLLLEFPEYAQLRLLFRGLCADAVIAAIDGDSNRAKRSLLAVQKSAAHMGQENVMLGELVSIANSKLGVRAAMRVLGEGGPKYAGVIREVAGTLPKASLADTLPFEAFGTALACRQTVTEQDFPGTDALKATADKARKEGATQALINRAWEARSYQFWTMLALQAKQKGPEGLGKVAEETLEAQEKMDATFLINVIGAGVTYSQFDEAVASVESIRQAMLASADILTGTPVAEAEKKHGVKYEKTTSGFSIASASFVPGPKMKRSAYAFEYPFKGR